MGSPNTVATRGPNFPPVGEPLGQLLVVTVLMIVDDPLPQRRLSIEWLTVLVEGHLGTDPTNLRPVLRPANLLGALKPLHVRVSEAWQA